MFWGLVIALISLPFYLSIVIPEIGSTMGIDSFSVFMAPLFASFLVSVILCDSGITRSLIAMVFASIFLMALLLFILMYPSLAGLVWFLDNYYIDIGTKMILSFVILFPSLLIGGVTGKVFGEFFISEQTKREKRELNERMREWKETLEKVLQEKLEEEMRQREKRDHLSGRKENTEDFEIGGF